MFKHAHCHAVPFHSGEATCSFCSLQQSFPQQSAHGPTVTPADPSTLWEEQILSFVQLLSWKISRSLPKSQFSKEEPFGSLLHTDYQEGEQNEELERMDPQDPATSFPKPAPWMNSHRCHWQEEAQFLHYACPAVHHTPSRVVYGITHPLGPSLKGPLTFGHGLKTPCWKSS